MSNPLQQADGVFSHVYPDADYGFTLSSGSIVLADNASVTSNVLGTGVPATVVFLSKLSAGSGTLNVDVGAAGFTPSFGSPTSTLALSGTSWQVLLQNTAFTFDDSSILTTTITEDERFFAIELVAGSGGMTVASLVTLVVYEYTPGEDWFQGIRAAANGVASFTLGDGTGLLNETNSMSSNPYLNSNVLL